MKILNKYTTKISFYQGYITRVSIVNILLYFFVKYYPKQKGQIKVKKRDKDYSLYPLANKYRSFLIVKWVIIGLFLTLNPFNIIRKP